MRIDSAPCEDDYGHTTYSSGSQEMRKSMGTKTYYPAVYQFVVGLTKPRYNTWLQLDVIAPTIPAKGSGTRSEWSVDDMLKGLISRRLVDLGFRVNEAFDTVTRILEAKNQHHVSKVRISEGMFLDIELSIFRDFVKDRIRDYLRRG